MKKIYIFSVSILLLVISGCFGGTYKSLFPEGHFDARYDGLLGEGSKIIQSRYNNVYFRTKDNHFLHRTYFPTTKQITSETTYMTRLMSRRQGSYKMWYDNGNLRFKGQHEFDLLDGFSQYFHWETGTKLAEGNYSKNQKTGNWKYYDTKERLTYELNYNKGEIEGNYIKYDTLGQVIEKNLWEDGVIVEQTDMKVSLEEALPYLKDCLDGVKAASRIDQCTNTMLHRSISKIIEYPTESREYDVAGSTLVLFAIDENGEMADFTIISGLDEYISAELHRVFGKLKGKLEWKAGQENGKPIQSEFLISIKFQLE